MSNQNIEDNQVKKNTNSSKMLWILLVCLLVGSIAYYCLANESSIFSKKSKKINPKTEEFVVFENINEENIVSSEQKDENMIDVNNIDLGEASMDSLDELIATRNIDSEEDKIRINVKTGGRRNPFMPYIERSISADGTFDLIEPPEYVPQMPQADELMKTTVSGILYDSEKPCAILNVDGVDQLVNKGDKIGEFHVVNITRKQVFVKQNSNVIAAEVGEAIEAPVMTYNKVYNLEKKFGGKYQPHKKGVIVINGQEY